MIITWPIRSILFYTAGCRNCLVSFSGLGSIGWKTGSLPCNRHCLSNREEAWEGTVPVYHQGLWKSPKMTLLGKRRLEGRKPMSCYDGYSFPQKKSMKDCCPWKCMCMEVDTLVNGTGPGELTRCFIDKPITFNCTSFQSRPRYEHASIGHNLKRPDGIRCRVGLLPVEPTHMFPG
jgi:hypothetical protein